MQIQIVDESVVVKLPDRFDVAAAPDSWRWMAPILSRGQDCLLDLSGVRFIDSTGVALLIRLKKRIRSMRRHLVLVAPGGCVRDALGLMQLGDYFDTAPDACAARKIISTRRQEEALRVARRPSDIATAVAWRGEITADSADEVWNGTRHLLEGSMLPPSIVIDLSDARFIDSTGLRVMVQTHQLARLRGTKLVFSGARPPVRNVLRNAGLDLLLLEKPELFNLIATSIPTP
jgi:anti-anti-sigma factor